MSATSNVTTDHETIQRWTEERGGHPATVKRTEKHGEPGILRIDFPGFSGEDTLEPIDWDEWFEAFDRNALAFLYRDRTAVGNPSRFNKLMSRDTAE